MHSMKVAGECKYPDGVQMDQRLPGTLGHDAERHHIPVQLLNRRHRLLRFTFLRVLRKGRFNEPRVELRRLRGSPDIGDFVLVDMPRWQVHEERLVVPDIDTDAVRMRRSEELAGG